MFALTGLSQELSVCLEWDLLGLECVADVLGNLFLCLEDLSIVLSAITYPLPYSNLPCGKFWQSKVHTGSNAGCSFCVQSNIFFEVDDSRQHDFCSPSHDGAQHTPPLTRRWQTCRPMGGVQKIKLVLDSTEGENIAKIHFSRVYFCWNMVKN